MERLSNRQLTISKLFILLSLILLATGMVWGILGGLQYIIPGFLKGFFSFEKIRPLHVSSVVFWIILSSIGCIGSYIQEHTTKNLYSLLLFRIQFLIFFISILAILISYCFGIFGGREYWEFNPILALPIAIGWILFIINFIKSIGSLKKQPVYVWMWLTGIFFFLFTFLESYLWLFPYFKSNIITDMTIQWKSYGSMVGSWNMLIYGSSIFLMDKISGNKTYSHSRIAYLLYFTGLFNLMFNWGHHIYTLPTHGYVKHISYIVSMTELFILGRIILQWKNTLSSAKKNYHLPAYRFLIVADIWVFLNLLLAITMSVPAINIYTHGTHITVAHAMGTTIGINSFLLLALIVDIFQLNYRNDNTIKKSLSIGFWITNISLFIFWTSMIIAGILKAKWQMNITQIPFSSMMLQLKPIFIVIFVSGTIMSIGFLLIIFSLIKKQILSFKIN